MSVEFDPQRLLQNWFKDCREDPDQIEPRMAWWFGSDPAQDRWLADQYLEGCEAALAGELDGLASSPRERLALILLLDQLPRNLFRGTARAFAGDARALRLCRQGHRAGMDQKLSLVERVFFWMPLQHAEDLGAQDLGVELYDTLAAADPYRSGLWKGFAHHARLHRDVIRRFGRFPHRNAALGRAATREETAYLEAGGHTFGA